MRLSCVLPWAFAAGQRQRQHQAAVTCGFTRCDSSYCAPVKRPAAQRAFHLNRQIKRRGGKAEVRYCGHGSAGNELQVRGERYVCERKKEFLSISSGFISTDELRII